LPNGDVGARDDGTGHVARSAIEIEIEIVYSMYRVKPADIFRHMNLTSSKGVVGFYSA
jgi:hypothetical protein